MNQYSPQMQWEITLTVVEDNTLYQVTEKTIPHDKDYRVGGYPKDSFNHPLLPQFSSIAFFTAHSIT